MLERIHLIRKRFRAAQDRQKSWVAKKRRELEFQVSDFVFLKVSSTKSVIRFGRHGKLSLRYVGPFEVLDRVDVAYKLALPPELSKVYNDFHVSSPRKFVPDLNTVAEYKPLQVHEDLTYEEFPIQTIDRKVQVLRQCIIPFVKIQWSNHGER